MRENSSEPSAPAGRSVVWSWLRRVTSVLAIAVIATIGLTIVPSAIVKVGPTTVSASARPGRPSTILRTPPLGTVSAATHWSPIQFQLVIAEIDVDRLTPLATTAEGRAALIDETEDDLAWLATRAAIQNVLGAALIGAIAGLIFFHRRWRWAAIGACSGGVTVFLLIAAAGITYDTDAFNDPTFRGPIGRARTMIDAIGKRVELLDEARSRYRTAAERMSDLFVVLGGPNIDPRESETVILHVSDIHANVLAYDYIEQLASDFDVDGVIDTGDISSSVLDTGELSSFETPVTNVIARRIRDLGLPYILVSGNHDSPATVDRIERVPNVTVLDRTSTEIGDLEIFGWGDPTYSTAPIPEDEKSQTRAAQSPEVADALDGGTADILIVHDRVLGQDAAGRVPLILAGHTHERGIEIGDETTVLTVGSTGATGLKSLTIEADRTYDAELLYFDGDGLVAVDYVQLESLNGDFRLARTTF